MNRIVKNISDALFFFRMGRALFFYFLKKKLQGSISLRQFWSVIGKLLHFQKNRTRNQKLVLMGKGIRTGLYVPTFPGEPFLRSCENFFNDSDKLKPTVVALSITNRCNFSCSYCFQRYDNKQAILPIDIITEVIKVMLDEGASIFTIEGGDPFLDYNRLRQVCTAIDSRAECWINTTGDGAEKQHIAELVSLGVAGLKISLHGRNEQEHNRFLGGRQGWDKMLSVISYCKEYGLTITFNSRIEPEGFFNGYFDEMMELGANLGALYIQFITPRTAGGNFKGETISYSTRQLEDIGGLINKYNNNREYVGYPGIFFDELDERCVFGCTAGNARFYINAAGDVQPCQHLNMSYGNIKDEPCRQIVKRMQEDFGCRSFTAHCTQIPTLIREQAGSNPVFPLDVSKLDREKLKKILKSDSKAAVNEK